MLYAPLKLGVWMVVRIRHLPAIMAAMLNENDEMYWGGDQRTTIYNHSQPADLTTHCKHTILYRECLPSCFYCPSLQLLDRGDGKAFSRLRYRPRAGRRVWAMPSEKRMTGKDKGNGGCGGKREEREGGGRAIGWWLPAGCQRKMLRLNGNWYHATHSSSCG